MYRADLIVADEPVLSRIVSEPELVKLLEQQLLPADADLRVTRIRDDQPDLRLVA